MRDEQSCYGPSDGDENRRDVNIPPNAGAAGNNTEYDHDGTEDQANNSSKIHITPRF